MPQNISDDRSDISSSGTTLKMDLVDPAGNKASKSMVSHIFTNYACSNIVPLERSRACTIMGVFLLVLLAGVSVAAGICYLNHMSES
jgi:hypothetical protein